MLVGMMLICFPSFQVLLQTILLLYRNQTMITMKLYAKVDQGLAPRDHKFVSITHSAQALPSTLHHSCIGKRKKKKNLDG
jgi:hypothetical protein